MRGSNGVLQSPLGMRNLRCEGHLSPENSPTEAFGVHLLHTWKQWSMMSVERLDMIERINHTWISADLAQDSTWQTNPRLVLQIETGPDLGEPFMEQYFWKHIFANLSEISQGMLCLRFAFVPPWDIEPFRHFELLERVTENWFLAQRTTLYTNRCLHLLWCHTGV